MTKTPLFDVGARTCIKCGAEKPLTDFYKHPNASFGRDTKCKSCAKEMNRQNRNNNLDYYRDYDRKRYYANPCRKEATDKWYKNKANTSPAMLKAVRAVSNAIRDGRLVRQPCEVCGECPSEAHHADYLRAYDVMWLCRSHHIKWHNEHGPGKNAEAPADQVDVTTKDFQ